MRKFLLVLVAVALAACTSLEDKYYTCVQAAFLTTKDHAGYSFDSLLKADTRVVGYCGSCIRNYQGEAAPLIAAGLILKSYKLDSESCDCFYVAAKAGFPNFYEQYCENGKARLRPKYNCAQFDLMNEEALKEEAARCVQLADDLIESGSQPTERQARYCYLTSLLYKRYPAVVRAAGIILYRRGRLKEANSAFATLTGLDVPTYTPDNTQICADMEMREKLPYFEKYCHKKAAYRVPDNQQPTHPLYNWAQLCKQRAKVLEDGGEILDLRQTCLACDRARKAFPRDPQLAKAHGMVLLSVEKKAACEAFSAAMVLGDSSAFLQYCNDGEPQK